MSFLKRTREMKFAAVLGAALAIAACAKNPAEDQPLLRALAQARGRRSRQSTGFRRQCRRQSLLRERFKRIEPTAQATLDKQARWLQQYARYSFTVEGHADERGTREYNFALGARRAEAAKDYLVARGIPISRIRTISYGKERPVASATIFPAGRKSPRCHDTRRRPVLIKVGEGPEPSALPPGFPP